LLQRKLKVFIEAISRVQRYSLIRIFMLLKFSLAHVLWLSVQK
jgi:hypothetical protein